MKLEILYKQFKILGWREFRRWVNKIKNIVAFCPSCRETWEYCDLYCKKKHK